MRHSAASGGRAAATVLLAALAFVSCNDTEPTVGPVGPIGPVGPTGSEDGDALAGSGNIVTDERTAERFDRIILSGEGTVVLSQGETESLAVETDDNLLEYIETEVRNGTLEIRTTEGIDIAPTNSVLYRIGFVDLNHIELLGAGSIEADQWSAEAMTIVLSGAGDIRISALSGTNLTVTHDGVGAIALAGAVDHQEVTASGVGSYEAGDLETRTAAIEVRETTAATVWVTETLEVVASGSSSVAYYGAPQVARDVSGSGTVRPLDGR